MDTGTRNLYKIHITAQQCILPNDEKTITYRILIPLASQTTYVHYLNVIRLIAPYAQLTNIFSNNRFPLQNSARGHLAT